MPSHPEQELDGQPVEVAEEVAEAQDTADEPSKDDTAALAPPNSSSSTVSRGGTPAAPLLALAASAAAAALFLLLRQLRQRKGGKVQRQDVGKHQVFATVLALREPSIPLPPPTAPVLGGRTFVLSDRLDALCVETRFGCDLWKRGRQPARHNYQPADVLVSAGAQGVALVHSEPLGLGPLLSTANSGTPNPAGKGRSHGGGEYGAAVAAAAGLADLALAVDELGSARVPAACCGAYALRCTAGALPLEGASIASPALAAPALLAADPQVLLKAGQALRLPGGGAATEVSSYLVAEDFFAACGEEARRMVPAVVAAVKRWAGPEQAQALSLCEWLYHRVAALEAFLPTDTPAAAAGRQQRSEEVLKALAAAAEALQLWEFAHKYGAWVEAHQQQLPPQVVQLWQKAQQVNEETYRAAQALSEELQSAMRAALRDGYVFVLPTTPAPAPLAATTAAAAANGSRSGAGSGASGSSSSEQQAGDAFRERCLQFSAVAALSGVPQVAVPLPVPGSTPLSISLLALHKRDLALLQAAAKLGPMLAEEAAALAAQQSQRGRGGEQPHWRPQAVAAEETKSSGGSSQPAGSTRRSSKQKESSGLQAAKAAAEARKEDGNTAFRAGRYEEAVRQYSAAIQLYPQAAVYYANRAMAYLKLGSYGAAEADCDESLKLELSAKALLRRGSARLAQGNAEGAKADFRQVLALEPQNRQAREELRGIEALEEQLQPGAF